MPRYVLVYTKKSKRKEVGEVVTYDKDGVIGIFHKKAPLTRELKPGMLVVARIISTKSKNRNYYILYPELILKNHKIPKKYDKNIVIWGRPAYKELRKRKVQARKNKLSKLIKKVDQEINKLKSK